MSLHHGNNKGSIQQLAEQYNSKHYDRIRILGKGSFGTAIVHRRRADCSLVVLKEIDLQKFKGEREKSIAIDEARIMSTLSHANIIKYHNAYTTESKLIIEMEYAGLGTLASYLSMHGSPLDEQEILIVFRQITSGLDYLHSKNIIHLDLKMTNIFVTVEGHMKIGDFGISQYMYPNDANNSTHLNQQTKNVQSSHLGTIAYSSPERCLDGLIDFKSDIWSLGCILYELITSKPLFTGASLPELVMSITRIDYQPIKRKIIPALREVFERMIARDPVCRPSAFELICIIDQLYARSQFINKQTRLNQKRQNYRFDLSTEVNLFAGGNQQASVMNQISYPHSLVYQVRLDNQHIQVERVNLPQSKRIKEISKGKSHYLVLTYDNIVYGWGSKTFGQLGACGLTSSQTNSGRTKLTRSARNSINSKDIQLQSRQLFSNSTTPTSLASSTQTISPNQNQANNNDKNPKVANNSASTKLNSKQITRQLVVSMLKESAPASRPFIINELNHRKIIQVVAGNNFSVFLSKTGIVMTCGDGSMGCLGRGQIDGACFTPCMVDSLLNMDIVSVACGPRHVVAICGNGRAYAWGKSTHGRLGIASQVGPIGSNLHVNGQLSKYILRPQLVQLPADVIVKRAYCGDRCTLFVDSANRCWACGENRYNKLGLDIKRRFKRTLMVDKCWLPREVLALSRYNIVACDIGKNHSSFITSEGKLIVVGQDIDYGYRLERNMIDARQSYRRIAAELQTGKRRIRRKQTSELGSNGGYKQNELNAHTTESVARTINYKRLAKSMIFNNQLTGFKFMLDEGNSASKYSNRYPCLKLNKLQQQQVELFVQKSRAIKKMPFECVISASCTPKFSLALTNDNRVYFWGTRTYKRDPDDDYLMWISQSFEQNRKESPGDKSTLEPQLVSKATDDCFIKIGQTNSTLMNSIQKLGSDQPIIHAQDPRLTADLLSDLWILDYKPIVSSDSESSSASSEISCSSSLNSCCDTCCSWQSELTCCGENRICKACETQQNDCKPRGSSLNTRPTEVDSMLRHDAILSPQSIVSLYIPSMFNHSGCSLHLVDLFCFDEDKFYLVLDTTIKQVHQGQQSQHSSHQPNNHQSNNQKQFSSNNNHMKGHQAATTNQQSLPASLAPSPKARLRSVAEAPNRTADTMTDNAAELDGNSAAEESEASKNKIDNRDDNATEATRPSQIAEDPGMAAKSERLSCYDDDENNNSNSVGPQLASVTSTSNCGVSLEEPRSFSTFANALGNHIIIGPSMDERDNSLGRDESMMQAMNFNSSAGSSPATREENQIPQHVCSAQARQSKRQRRRLISNRSESTIFAGEETSSMPSWVKNEYMQYQINNDYSDPEPQSNGGACDDADDDADGQVFLMEAPASSERAMVGTVSRSSTHSSSTLSGSSTEVNCDKDRPPSTNRRHLASGSRGSSSSSLSASLLTLSRPQPAAFNEFDGTETEVFASDQSGDYAANQVRLSNYLDGVTTTRPRVPHRISASHPDMSDYKEQVKMGANCGEFDHDDGRHKTRRNSDFDNSRQQAIREPANLISCQVYKKQMNGVAYESSMNSAISSRVNSHNPLLRAGESNSEQLLAEESFRQNEPAISSQTGPAVNDKDNPKSISTVVSNRDLVLLAGTTASHLSQSVQLHPPAKDKRFSSTSSLQSLRRSLARLFC